MLASEQTLYVSLVQNPNQALKLCLFSVRGCLVERSQELSHFIRSQSIHKNTNFWIEMKMIITFNKIKTRRPPSYMIKWRGVPFTAEHTAVLKINLNPF